MTAPGNATPLLALDAVVIDIETTGLDPLKARMVEIAGIRLSGARPSPVGPFRRLVNPGERIPASASAIHGIDDDAVADAPLFDRIWPELADYLGDGVVIGHSLGFDLAVLKNECERAGIAWRRPRTLDTRLLAEVAEPNLAGYSLEHLSAWLGVELGDRHSAYGDALMTARIFVGLLPKLRERGVRTLAEAENSCRTLTPLLDKQHQAGWVEVVAPPSRTASERILARIDSYPYRHRVRDVMSTPAKFARADMTLGDALTQMARERISSLFVLPPGKDASYVPRPAETGIITERDVLRVLAEHSPDVLMTPIAQIMSRPLAAVPAVTFIYRAIGRMSRLKLRHLGVTDEDGRIIGALSARDLLRLRAEDAVSLGDEIDEAKDSSALARAWAKLPQVASGLVAEEVSGVDIAAVISSELRALTRQAALLAEQRLARAGQGGPPCPYAIAVLGSAGRGESLLAMDQDNAIVFAEGEPGSAQDRWFEALATVVSDILHEVGVPYCPGGVMAKNPPWRGSLDTWRTRVDGWIRRMTPEDVLSVDIFFDFLGVHGDTSLTQAVWKYGFDAAKDQVGFAKLLAEAAGETAPGLGLLGRFKTEQGRIDLKRSGLFGIVSLARVLAIRHHVVERSTPARLAGIKALGLGADRDLDDLMYAQPVFMDLIIRQQLEDIEQGLPATNAVSVKRLSHQDRERLHGALEAVRHLNDLTRDLLFNA